MTRRHLIAGLAAAPALRSQTPPFAVQHSAIATNPVGVPTVGDGMSRFGLLVQVYSDRAEVEAYIIRLRYRLPGRLDVHEQIKATIRQRSTYDQWTPEAFWTGEPCEVVDLDIRELGAI